VLILASLAWAEPPADTGFGCGEDQLTETLPAAGAEDVAVDVVPTLYFADCGGADANGIVRLWLGEDLVLEDRVDNEVGDYSWVGLDVELEANTGYRMDYTPADGGVETLVEFTTGDHTAEPVATAPTWDSEPDWTWNRSGDRTEFSSVARWGYSDEGITFIEARDRDDTLWATMVGYGTGSGMYGRAAGRLEGTCVRLRQRDVTGDWIEGEESCLDGRASACSTAPVGGLVAALLALCGVRRRRC